MDINHADASKNSLIFKFVDEKICRSCIRWITYSSLEREASQALLKKIFSEIAKNLFIKDKNVRTF